MKKVFLFFFLTICQFVNAQEKGTVKGLLIDKEMNNESLPFANVFIKGTTIGVTSDMDGIYTLSVEEGTYTLVFSFLGYKTIEKEITVKALETLTVNQAMGAEEGVALDAVVIKATTNKEKESALLLEQKKIVSLKTKIGAQELRKKGVGNVANALIKTTGISKEEGTGGVFVRGLGDRYNVTTLNGLPLPSNNASKKNIDLNIFSTDIVEFIGIDKTYDAKNYGDFAGANVNISSKNYKGKGFLEFSIGSAANSEALSQSNFYLSDGPNRSGFYSTNYPAFPIHNYNFLTSWDRQEVRNPVNSNFALKGGDSYTFEEGTKLNFFTVASFDNGYQFKEGISRGSINRSGVARRDYNFKSYAYDTNSTFMVNARLKHKNQELKYNALYINTSSENQDEYLGTVDVFDYAREGGAFVQRTTFERTQLIVHQLLGVHEVNETVEINWGASYNFVDNKVPNRRQIILTPDNWDIPDGPKSFKKANNESDNHRFYQRLEEEEIAANVAAIYQFSKDEEDEFKGKVTLGYNGRFKNVIFRATQFNFAILDRKNQPFIEDVYNLDSYFNPANFNARLFEIKTFRGGLSTTAQNVLLPQTYDGDQQIHAGYVSVEYQFSEIFTGVFGLRGEQINQSIRWNTSIRSGGPSELNLFEVLPAISLKYEVNNQQNLKLATSKTYTLPQYKERALFQYEEVTQAYIGNPALYTSTDYNLDIKWDFFPTSSELISVGVFGKLIKDPINEATINSASNDVSWVNSGDQATVIGAEFEIRKKLFETAVETEETTLKNTLTLGFNTSLMSSSQNLDSEKVIRETTAKGFPISVDFSEDKSKLTGASDILLNADISYFKDFSKDKNIQTTVAYNYFSDRVFALGTEGKGNLIDAGVGTLDFILKTTLNKNLGIGFSAKNILNPTITRKQETQNVIVSSFKAGVNVKLSVTYNF